MTKKGVSIVNVTSTAFLRYANIFKRSGTERIEIHVSVITDLDVKPDKENDMDGDITVKESALRKKKILEDQNVKVFVSPHWTLEYCLFRSPSLTALFQGVVREVHPGTDWDDFETALAEKLNKKTLKKSEIAFRLAKALEEDLNLENPHIIINEDDEFIKYILEGIKYAV